MKRKLLAVLMAGIMVGALAACGGNTEVTEEPPIPVEEETEEEEPEEQQMLSPDHVYDIPEGIWIYGKSRNYWVVTEGLFWHLVDEYGETAVEGTNILR